MRKRAHIYLGNFLYINVRENYIQTLKVFSLYKDITQHYFTPYPSMRIFSELYYYYLLISLMGFTNDQEPLFIGKLMLCKLVSMTMILI